MTKPLFEKLGIRQGMKIHVIHAPLDYASMVGHLPGWAQHMPLQENLDLIHLFTSSIIELDDIFQKLKPMISKNGSIWISWSKLASGISRDFNENDVRTLGLARGLVHNEECSMNEQWTALRFVYGLKDR
jgi:hypothetical protein